MTETTRNTLHIGEIYRVEIEKVAHGGHFIARHEGAVIFLRHGIPGEIVDVEITSVEKTFYRGDVVAVLEASPSRVSPPCHYARSCGGCDFQHITVERQRELKSDVISEQFARIAKMEVDVEVEEVSSPLHWRTRFAASTNARGEIGFKGSRSNAVVPTSTCPVLIPEIDLTSLPLERLSANQRVEVNLGTNGERTISIMDQREDRSAQRPVSKIIEGPQVLRYRVNEREYQVSQSSFWQSNINAPEKLIEVVLEFAEFLPGDHLLDLYGGVGLFAGAALPIIGPSGRIDIVEGSSLATDDAKRNFDADENVHVHTGDVARAIRKFKGADVIVLDPPRTGAGKPVIESLSTIGARAIVYVACDPAALARDTTYLNEIGYRLEKMRALDLFPMTHHIESVALFTLIKVS